MPTHVLDVALLPLAVVLGVDFGAMLLLCDGGDLILGLLKEVVEEVILGEF